MESLKLSFPKSGGIRVQIIHKMHNTRPNLSSVILILIIWMFEEDIHIFSSAYGFKIID
jgi:hypothetical protein